MKKLLLSIPMMFLSLLLITGVASAHVKVQPQQVTADSYQHFTVSVPTEKDIPTTEIRLVIPDNVDVSSFKPKAGWTYKTKTDDNDKITEVTWTAEGKGLLPEQFEEFDLMAHVDKNAKTIAWKAYQTYSDGSIVKWIGPEDSENPASVTTVVASDSDADDSDASQWPLYISIIAIVLGVIAIIIALVKRK